MFLSVSARLPISPGPPPLDLILLPYLLIFLSSRVLISVAFSYAFVFAEVKDARGITCQVHANSPCPDIKCPQSVVHNTTLVGPYAAV